MNKSSNENLYQDLLSDYYQALQSIDSQHQQMNNKINAQSEQISKASEELIWHETELKKAAQLAADFGESISTLPAINFNYTSSDRNRVDMAFKNASNALQAWVNLGNEQKKQIDILQNKLETQQKDLNQQLSQAESDLIDTENNLENLKTQKILTVINLKPVDLHQESYGLASS